LAPADDEGELDRAIRRREQQALAEIPDELAGVPLDLIALRPENIVSLDALRALLSGASSTAPSASVAVSVPVGGLSALVEGIEAGGHGLVLCMGKGGVGKTTIAAALAVALAQRGHDVHLTTTDPAAHLHEVLPDVVPGLQVSRIDPVEATRSYRQRVMDTKGKHLDEAGRAHLAEDLQSPCTEEIAVFQQFSKVVLEGRRRFVVVDTAPTGHTLLLLDTAGAYHRDMVRQAGDKIAFHTPLMLLQDPDLTKVLLVTTPEPTPVTEAAGLQDDLDRAGIRPWAWVLNGSVAAADPQSCLLQARGLAEAAQFERVERLAQSLVAVPLLADEPTGAAALAALVDVPEAATA
jgi:arsenite-transporting ATPase